jgi:hypothetical protein
VTSAVAIRCRSTASLQISGIYGVCAEPIFLYNVRTPESSTARREPLTAMANDPEQAGRRASYLPPIEPALERFVSNGRRVRASDQTRETSAATRLSGARA